MSRLASVNFLIGFLVIFTASAAGAFIGLELTQNEVSQIPESWGLVLRRSAHGHFNLFGFLHIAFGLTMAHSHFGARLKLWQTVGLLLGTLAMGPGMLVRSFYPASSDLDLATVLVSLGLSASLFAVGLHSLGLLIKLQRSSSRS